MRDIQTEFVQLRTAALASGKITAAQIIEATKGLDTLETRYSVLLKLTEGHNITIPVPESDSDKIAKLTEKALASGKLTSVEIIESMNGCSNEHERFEALRSLTVAKKIGVTRIDRKNGSAVIAESARPTKDERVQKYMRAHKCSFREASILAGLPDPGPTANESGDAVSERAKRWKRYSPILKESEIEVLAKRGVEPN